jgi:hypothetical protein
MGLACALPEFGQNAIIQQANVKLPVVLYLAGIAQIASER